MSKQIIVDKLNSYKDYKKELEYKKTVALSLNFETEVLRLKHDIVWCKKIIDLINEIDEEK